MSHITDCPACGGQTELNGAGGISCYFCGYEGHGPPPGRSRDQITVTGYAETSRDIHVRCPHDRFDVWRGRDPNHQDLSVQIRLQDNGEVFLSCQQGHVSTLMTARITLEELHELIRNTIRNATDPPPAARGAPETDRLRRKNAGKAVWEALAGKLELERNKLLSHKQHMLAVARAAGFESVTAAIVAAGKWAATQDADKPDATDKA